MGKAEAFALAALIGVAAAAGAGWRDQASAFDVQRLADLGQSRAKGLQEAAAAAPADVDAVRSLLEAGTVAAEPRALQGIWRCRMMKLGGLTPAIVYGWFRCRISEKNGALVFEKLTGSQRTRGTLYPEDRGFVYLGASFVAGEKPHGYSGKGASVGAPATPDDEIGLLSLLYDGRARLELPAPVQESDFEVIELKR